jgi:hypothetical protein
LKIKKSFRNVAIIGAAVGLAYFFFFRKKEDRGRVPVQYDSFGGFID